MPEFVSLLWPPFFVGDSGNFEKLTTITRWGMLDWVGDKELQAMSTEELDAVQEQAMCEFTEAGDKLSAMLKKAEPLKQLSADEKKQ